MTATDLRERRIARNPKKKENIASIGRSDASAKCVRSDLRSDNIKR